MKREKGYPLPLGVSERGEFINFSVAVERGNTCVLKLYKKGSEEVKEKIELIEDDAIGEVRFVSLQKTSVKNLEYVYEIAGEDVVDPYAKAVVTYEDGVRGRIVNEDYDWEDDKFLRLPDEEVVAYSLHVRGFSKDDGTRSKKKGTFQGVMDKISYLTELGINQIQCMPVYAFKENYWGYGDAYWFAVKENYAAGKFAEKELKDMVKACHKAGIEVVLHMPFVGGLSKQVIVECLRYYVMDYHVDGFIVNPYVISIEELELDPILRGTKLLQCKDDFQNVMRQFLKGDSNMVDQVLWWLKQKGSTESSYNYITNHTGFTLADLVSYNQKHNGANGEENQDGPEYNYSWNCGEEGPTKQKSIQELREKQVRNAFFLLLFANGTPCLLAGDEFGNSQGGNNNVYCQDNPIAWLNWKELENHKELFLYVKTLIALRKSCRFLYKEVVNKDGIPVISYHGKEAWKLSTKEDNRQIGIYYHDEKGDIQDVFVAYNMLWYKQDFALPELSEGKEWHFLMSTEDGMFEERVEAEKRTAVISGRSIAVFVGK